MMLFLGAWLTVRPVIFLSHFFSQNQGENYTAEIILMLDIFPKKAFNFILIAKSVVVPI